jgi:hypothetical protein
MTICVQSVCEFRGVGHQGRWRAENQDQIKQRLRDRAQKESKSEADEPDPGA